MAEHETKAAVRSKSKKKSDRGFQFTTLVDTDKPVVSVSRHKRKLGSEFCFVSPNEIADLKSKTCNEIRYTKNGVATWLQETDMVILKNGEFGLVTKVFSDGHFCIDKRKVLYTLRELAINLSIIHDYEQDLLDRNRYWYVGTQVEIFSRSRKKWFMGTIEKVFSLESEDPDAVHAEKWFSLRYKVEGVKQFKQLPWHSRYIRTVFEQSKTAFTDSDDDEHSSFEESCSVVSGAPSSTSATTWKSSLRNSIFE